MHALCKILPLHRAVDRGGAEGTIALPRNLGFQIRGQKENYVDSSNAPSDLKTYRQLCFMYILKSIYSEKATNNFVAFSENLNFKKSPGSHRSLLARMQQIV